MKDHSDKNIIADLKKDLRSVHDELAFQNEEKEKRADELVVVNEELAAQSKLIEIQKAYYIEHQLLEKTLMCIGDAVISMDENRNVLVLNKVAEAVTGWTQEEACGKSIYKIFNIMNEFTRKKSEDIVEKVFSTGDIHQLANHTILVKKDGSEILIEDSAAPILNEKNEIVGVVIIFRDYTEKWERLKKIEHMAFHDELTGLYNRRFYEEKIIRINKKSNLPLSLIMGDVNGLKLINDSFGHEVGDELLIKAAEAIKMGCREDDLAARLGGDEFIIALPRTSAADAAHVLSHIKNHLFLEKVNGLKISISFGCQTKTEEKQDIRDLFKNTEDQMYRHKIYESAGVRKETINLIIGALYAKNARELIHSQRVSELCVMLSTKLGLDEEEINRMRLAGLMHDIGKISISDKILNKPAKLDQEEYNEIMRHPEIGYRILIAVKEFSEIADYILQHQEKWDGTGYPRGLKGEEIGIEARIIAVAEAYDAMTTEKPYSPALTHVEALREIKKWSGAQFDPDVAKVFISQVYQPYGI